MSNSVTSFYWTPIFEWMKLGVAPRMDTKIIFCLKMIGLHAQNMISILGLIVNIIGRTYMNI